MNVHLVGSCQGARVRLIDLEELNRVNTMGTAMGYSKVVEDGKIVHVDGRCIFLQRDARCRIHSTYGWDAKPQVCKQFPLVATRVDGDLRIGVDPACFSSMRRVITGHELDLERVVVGRVSVSDNEAQLERHLVHFCESGLATPASICFWICGMRPDEANNDVPSHLMANVWRYLRQSEQRALLVDSSLPEAVITTLNPLAVALDQFSHPPRPPRFSKEEAEWSIESLRRILFLRLYYGGRGVALTCMASMIGSLLAASVGIRGQSFGQVLAAWVRLMRYPMFWEILFPDADTLSMLVRPQ